MTGELARPGLRRVLRLRDLVFHGIVLITPIAPVGVFGVASKLPHGHAASTILFAMAAMMLTAVSYGRMAARYPAAGSATTLVSLTMQRLAPAVPFLVWAALVTAAMTLLNPRASAGRRAPTAWCRPA